jgi:hypothetical protein
MTPEIISWNLILISRGLKDRSCSWIELNSVRASGIYLPLRPCCVSDSRNWRERMAFSTPWKGPGIAKHWAEIAAIPEKCRIFFFFPFMTLNTNPWAGARASALSLALRILYGAYRHWWSRATLGPPPTRTMTLETTFMSRHALSGQEQIAVSEIPRLNWTTAP